MAIEGFDFKGFAKNLAQQAAGVFPPGLSDNDKRYIINLVHSYCILAGEALYNDTSIQINADQACTITQFIGEWTFHKTIDTIKTGIPVENRDEILQKVAFTVFEIAKLAILKNLPMEQVVVVVEQQVKKTFNEAVQGLQDRGIISADKAKAAVNHSNLDEMAVAQHEEEQRQRQAQAQAQAQQQQQAQHVAASQASDKKILKIASFALILKKMPQEKVQSILKKFSQEDANLILQYIKMPDLEKKLDSTIAIKYLKEIKANFPEVKNLNAASVNKKLQKIVKNSDISKISAIIKNEREVVKEQISNTQTSQRNKVNKLSPRITDILCSYIEEKVRR